MFDHNTPENQDFSEQWEICIHSWIRQAIDKTLLDLAWSDLHSMTVEVGNIKTRFEMAGEDIDDIVVGSIEGYLESMKQDAKDIKDDLMSASHPEQLIIPFDAALFIEISSFLYVLG